MTSPENQRTEQVYLNEKQLAFLEGDQKRRLFMGGRGAGKSTALGAINVVRMRRLPKAKVAWVSFSIRHLKNKVVPPALAFIRQCGFKEHLPGRPGHYVKYKKPPSNWAEPHKPPDDYSNVITFSSGYTVELITWHMSDTERGSDFDGMDIDEAGWLKQSIFDGVLMPSVRANQLFYEDNPWHLQICFYTSKPRLPKGMWLHNYEKLAKEYPEEYKFVKCTSWDNKAVLGEKLIKHWEREMNPLEYAIEIMCEDPGELPNGFYNEYNEDRHSYFLAAGQSDVDPNEPLFLSFDFNAGFICAVVGQEAHNELRFVNELFV